MVVSAFSPAHGARAVDALAEGAFELVAKPAFGEPLETFTSELGRKVGEAAHSGRTRRPAPRRAHRAAPAPDAPPAPAVAGKKLVVIACSTGGPKALGELIPQLPSPLGAGTVIVQHMPPGFTASLADPPGRRLAARRARGRRRRVARPDTWPCSPPAAPTCGSAPTATPACPTTPPVGGLRPRADFTIEDAAKLYGPRMLLVVLTGMGRDGLEGAKAVRAAGGRILCEAESTCTVYGMPRAVAEAGLADEVLPLDELADAIAREAGR